MFIIQIYIFFVKILAFSFRLPINSYTPISQLNSHSYNDSLFRTPIPGEEIRLPKINEPTGEILLDRPLIERVATLRTFIESIEINRGKLNEETDLLEFEEEDSNPDKPKNEDKKFVEINEENLKPIENLLTEEDLLEEVLNNALQTYSNKNDIESAERLKSIAEQIVPIACKMRKEKSETNIMRLINCYMDPDEDLDKVLEELQEKRALDKYLLKKLDELINLAAKKYRISEKHPSISEEFLRIIKDRIAAQRITTIRGTDLYVKTLSLCLRNDDEDNWDKIISENIKSIENLEEFHEWIEDGIQYCKDNNRIPDEVDKMEKILNVIVRQHPIWNPKPDHIELEDNNFEEDDREKYRKYFEK